jgi:hypothetical protein
MLRKANAGKGLWHEELASQSEAIVKAERSEIEVNEETITKLQEDSMRVIHSKKKEADKQF